VGVLSGVATICHGERAQRVVVVERRLEDDRQLLEAGRDDRALDRLLVGQMLVDRGGADARRSASARIESALGPSASSSSRAAATIPRARGLSWSVVIRSCSSP